MERHDDQQKVGLRSRPLLQLTVVLVVMGALGMVWVTTRPSTSTACTLLATIDEVGAATPGASLARWRPSEGWESTSSTRIAPADRAIGQRPPASSTAPSAARRTRSHPSGGS